MKWILIDLGNNGLRYSIFENSEFTIIQEILLVNFQIKKFAQILKKFNIKKIFLTSVNPIIEKQIQKLKLPIIKLENLISSEDFIGISIKERNIGADLLAMLYANKYIYRLRNSIIFSLGTVHVALQIKNYFLEGVLLVSGNFSSFKAILNDAALISTKISLVPPAYAWGTNTETAISNGLIINAYGFIKTVLNLQTFKFYRQPGIIITGGFLSKFDFLINKIKTVIKVKNLVIEMMQHYFLENINNFE